MKKKKTVFTDQPIEVNGTVIHFDGKHFAHNNTLKIYRFRGDVTLLGQAIQNFCIANNIDKAIIK